MKKNIIEIEFSDFMILIIFLLLTSSIIFFFIGMTFGYSGEYEKGYLRGYKQCITEFNITGSYDGIKGLSKEGN